MMTHSDIQSGRRTRGRRSLSARKIQSVAHPLSKPSFLDDSTTSSNMVQSGRGDESESYLKMEDSIRVLQRNMLKVDMIVKTNGKKKPEVVDQISLGLQRGYQKLLDSSLGFIFDLSNSVKTRVLINQNINKMNMALIQLFSYTKETKILKEFEEEIYFICTDINNALLKLLDNFDQRTKIVRMLYLKISEAKDLVTNEFLHLLPDPFVSIVVDSKERDRTQVCHRTITPDWLEQFYLAVGSQSREVTFRVFNEMDAYDEFLGETSADIRELKDGDIYEDWLPLYPKGKGGIISEPVNIILSYQISHYNKTVGKIKFVAVSFGDHHSKLVVTFITQESKEKYSTKSSKSGTWNTEFDYNFDTALFEDTWIKLMVVTKKGRHKNPLGELMFPISEYITEKYESSPAQNLLLYLKPIQKGYKLGQIRVVMQYSEHQIRREDDYEELYQLLSDPDRELCSLIYNICSSVSERKQIFSHVVAAFESRDYAVEFISSLTEEEISKTVDENTIFRSNSWASIVLDVYSTLVGEDLLRNVLTEFLSELYKKSKTHSCELDPERITVGDPKKNKAFLIDNMETIFNLILDNEEMIPNNLRKIFRNIRNIVAEKWPSNEEIVYLAPSGFLFLRFFCAAILSPNLFKLMEVTQSKQTPRNLLIISKVLMNLANLCTFRTKELSFVPLNPWIEEKIPVIKYYLEKASVYNFTF
eukprot:TRINITY_DN3362_c0_g2_i3.p1 TRINITY_DN3362_c0_g2~~TRINITY_DN3362_c0_g2_i3.p1  ORF type:complete len:702 (-),score=128.11 TRINITY_DN3362_c0_g2_i3:370-2475(-)